MKQADWDIRQLLNLLAIARTGSFSRASQGRGISQPGLSASIAQLESAIGRRVLDRGRNGATLTAAGAALARHAEIIETQLLQASAEIELQGGGLDGPLNLAVTPVTAVAIVPEAIGRLQRERPDVAVTIWETVHAQAMEGLATGAVDLCIGPLGVYPTPANCQEIRLTDDRFCIVMRPDHPLSKRRAVWLRELDGVQWVLPSDLSAYRRQVEALFLTAARPWPARAAFTNSLIAMKGIVRHSQCLAIMPEQVVRQDIEQNLLKSIKLRDAGNTRQVGVIHRSDRPLGPLAVRFTGILQERFGAAGPAGGSESAKSQNLRP